MSLRLRKCLGGSENAWEDPNGLAYCVESRLSKAMLENNEIYKRFVDILGDLLQNEMAVDRLIKKLRRSEQVISDLIDSEEVILRMRHFKDDNGQSIGLERSRDLITSQRESLETAVRQRNSYLVKACRKAALSKSCAL